MNNNVLKLFFACVMTCGCAVVATAQKFSVKSVSMLPADLLAKRNPRTDAAGNDCAIVKFSVVGVKDLRFEDAVGAVEYSKNDYIVYVPENLKVLRYTNGSGTISGTVQFEDWGLDIEGKRVYSVLLDSDNHLRAAIFEVSPATAQLMFDGHAVALDENGLAVIEKPIGDYRYKVEGAGHEPRTGVIRLTADAISTTTHVTLAAKMYPLTLDCSPAEATLFVDNIPYGSRAEWGDSLKLSEGEHVLRLTAVGYKDCDLVVRAGDEPLVFNVAMQQLKENTIVFSEERTRTSVNLRPATYISFEGELFDKDAYYEHDYGLKLEFSFIQHFGALFALREGIGGGVMSCDEENYDEDSDNVSWQLEAPLQIGISVPFGKFNKNLFSVFGGGYGKMFFTSEEDDMECDYGVRFTAQFDFNRFVIGAEASKSLCDMGAFYGVRVGYKIK